METNGNGDCNEQESNASADDKGKEYEKLKLLCSSLKQQIGLLNATNLMLSEQLRKQTEQISGLTRGNGKQQKAVDSFAVFPEELWEVILEYVLDSKDLLNVSRTSEQLNSVLHPGKGTWMFQLVLGFVSKYLSRQDVLNCRQTCRKWNGAIDSYLENHPSRLPFAQILDRKTENELKRLKLSSSVTFHLWDVERIRTLREEMRDHPRNPFVGRSVVFNVEIDDDFDDEDEDEFEDPGVSDFWQLSRVFLSEVGRHLWYVEIVEDSGHQRPLEFYKLLRELLINLPNLRSLKLSGDISHEDYHPKALPVYMANNPLPPMPHMESLDLECLYSEVPQIIHDMLISMYSVQLKKVHVNMNRWKPSYSRGLSKQLTELHLKEVSLEKLTTICSPTDGKLSSLNVGKLSLNLRSQKFSLTMLPMKFPTFSFFKALSHLFPVLRVLTLFVDITVELNEMEPNSWQQFSLPSVEQVEVQGVQRKIFYSFLLCFPSLKSLSICESTCGRFNEDPAVITFLEGDTTACEEVVQVNKFMHTGRMYESNIWTLIPTLNVFSFRRLMYGDLIFEHNCNRETYNFIKNQREIEN